MDRLGGVVCISVLSFTDKENHMNKYAIAGLFLATTLASTATFFMDAYADSGGEIQISSPADNAEIEGKTKNEVVFDVRHSPDGNHLHFYVDNGDPTIVRHWKGSFTLPALPPGKHTVCIKEAMVNHVLTGLQKCISLNAK